MRTVQDVINSMPRLSIERLKAPPYHPLDNVSGSKKLNVGMAVPSMRDHTTDEGWQIFAGLEKARYRLCGYGLHYGFTDLRAVLQFFDPHIGSIVVQDKREWEGRTAGAGFDLRERFLNVRLLADRPDLFRLTILKDSHQQPHYHREAAAEMGANAWIVYYHPRIVAHLAPYVRPEHLIRTYHTIDSDLVPPYSAHGRADCLLSGAVSGVYPLRSRLIKNFSALKNTVYLPHPGYGRTRCHTPQYLKILSGFRVAICTSSLYGYALRKIIEATACGCRVITDLPVDDILPGIDENLVRIDPSSSVKYVSDLVTALAESYNPAKQEDLASIAKAVYDYREMGRVLARDVERLRETYSDD